MKQNPAGLTKPNLVALSDGAGEVVDVGRPLSGGVGVAV